MEEDHIVRMVDRAICRGEDVAALVREGNYERACAYGDHISLRAVQENQDWWWDGWEGCEAVDSRWLSSSFAHAAMAIHYGSKFPERQPQINRLKKILADYFETS